MKPDATDRKIILETQAGLPLVAEPYAAIAKTLGLNEDEVLSRMQAMQARGVIRRVAVAPNHYRLGLTKNGMTVWDVNDAEAVQLGAKIGALDFVSHCYLRPRARPLWPYNLFAMVHGASEAEVNDKRARIKAVLGAACCASDMLLSKRILKKTGLRLAERRA